jgi:hypothetical protein
VGIVSIVLVLVGLVAGPASAGMSGFTFGTAIELNYTASSSNPGYSQSGCGSGSAVVGFKANMTSSGNWVSNFVAHCQPLSWADGNVVASGTVSDTSVVGYSGSGTTAGPDLSCAAGQVVVGWVPRAGSWMDAIEPVCQGFSGVTPSGTTTNIGVVGDTGGAEQTAEMCPTGAMVTGLRVHVDTLSPDPEAVAEAVSLFCQPMTGVSAYQPDAHIGSIGKNLYSTDPLTYMQNIHYLKPGTTFISKVSITNRGTVADSYALSDAGGSVKPYTVTYWHGTKNITTRVMANNYATPSVAPGATVVIRIDFAISPKAGSNAGITTPLTVTSRGDGTVDGISACLWTR